MAPAHRTSERTGHQRGSAGRREGVSRAHGHERAEKWSAGHSEQREVSRVRSVQREGAERGQEGTVGREGVIRAQGVQREGAEGGSAGHMAMKERVECKALHAPPLL